MRVSVSLRSGYGVSDVRAGARWMVEQASTAWQAGLDGLFVGDHHVTGYPYYQNSPILGRLLAEWGERTAGALYLLALWPPVLAAEQIGTLAAIAEGPFVLQCALGAGEEQFSAMGADFHKRVSTFETNLAAVRRLLDGEAVNGARIGPLPPAPVSVWIGGGAPPAVDRAARLGDGWIAGPEVIPSKTAALVALYRERCAVHGRVPETVAIRRDVHVGIDDEDAWRIARPILDAGYRGIDPSATIVGGPDHVARQLETLAEQGYSEVIVRPLATDQADGVACLARVGEVRSALARG